MSTLVTLDAIRDAQSRIAGLVRRTPVLRAANLSEATGIDLHLKLENLQVTGAFKERGAANRLLCLTDEERARGVVAASAGNHAQGVAINATRLGVEATIVMPEYTPLVKRLRTQRYGAEVVLHGAAFDDANRFAQERCANEGKTFIHPFDDADIIAGQGTVALELLEDLSELDAVIVPVGGGGLISGMAVAIKALRPEIEVIGAESAAFPSMARALIEGGPIEVDSERTIADGIAVRLAGRNTYAHVSELVDAVVDVSEEEIAKALVMLLEEERVVAEGAAAAALAVVIGDHHMARLRGKRVALVISGGNIDVNMMERIIDRGLVRAGRRARLTLGVPDRPGTLARLTELIAAQGCNVLEIRHERAFSKTAVGETELEVEIETSGHEELAALRGRLVAEGYSVVEG